MKEERRRRRLLSPHSLVDDPPPSPRLASFPSRSYFLNVDEIVDESSGDTILGLDESRAICLKSCPDSNDTAPLRWICDYPDGPPLNGSITMEEWVDMEYDYFEMLDTAAQESSFAFEVGGASADAAASFLSFFYSFFHASDFPLSPGPLLPPRPQLGHRPVHLHLR